ncbi:ATP-dependent 6-phosphofructokinase [Candidatus Sumerlaeota bacterium]|nr:ATP-dependent 6-phosphofructokinase [Candidatus Sumerlaeota bacterium]
MESHEALSIPRLGEAAHASPLNLSEVHGDFIADFVPEDARVYYNPGVQAIRAALDQGEEPLAFEVAGPRRKLYFDPKADGLSAAIVTCGGLCPGINDVIRSLVMELWHRYGVRRILGCQYGFLGLTPSWIEQALNLTPEMVDHIQWEGGSFLRSSRGAQDVPTMVDMLQRENVSLLFTIGGDGTTRGALEIVKEIERRGAKIAVVGLPKTIDNDVCYTEKTFGYETAFSTARDAVMSAHTEARGALNGVGLVKVMGRNSGSIAAQAALASGEANFVIVPEVPFELEGPRGFLEALRARLEARRHALVVVAEGAGQSLMHEEAEILGLDKSGNKKLADIGLYLKLRIADFLTNIGMEHTVKYIDPSYIIRSVPANAADSVFCLKLAQNAVHAAMTGRTGIIIGYCNQHFVHIPMSLAISGSKRLDPDGPEWRAVLEATGQPTVMINH